MTTVHRLVCACQLSITLSLVCAVAHSQSFGASIDAGIILTLPTTSEGGGGGYIDEPPPVGPLEQSTLAISPLAYSNSVTGYDPQVNAIITAEGSAGVQLASAYKGSLSFSVATSGDSPTDAPGSGYGYAVVTWTDTLFITNLRIGTPVDLKVTYVVSGGYKNTTSGYSNGDMEYAFQITDTNYGDAVDSETTVNEPTMIASRHSYILRAHSGDTLSLLNTIVANFSGSTSWSISASINTAMVYIDVITPHAILSTASQVDYSSSDLVVVPSVTGDPESIAVNALISDGFTVDSITTQASKRVAAGDVISQSPSGNSHVVSGAPINLVVSSGPPTK